MVGHVGGDLALSALVLELLDLARGLNVVVLKEGKGSLLVDVLDLLGLGVDLLLSLSLTTVKLDEGVDAALGLEASLLNGEAILKGGGVEDKSVNGEVNSLLDFGSTKIRMGLGICSPGGVSGSCLPEKLIIPQVRDKVASLNIDREFLASWAGHENLHFPFLCTSLN